MIDSLFVYGTLAPGQENEHLLAAIAGTWKPATVKGKLRSPSWVAKFGYPGIDLSARDSEVKGLLFTSKQLSKNWGMLDEFEGEAYKRVRVDALCEDGSVLDAYVYEIQLP